jgi:hypothetical protein
MTKRYLHDYKVELQCRPTRIEEKTWETHQDKALAKIKSSAALSLGEIEHWNASSMLWESDRQLQEVFRKNA